MKLINMKPEQIDNGNNDCLKNNSAITINTESGSDILEENNNFNLQLRSKYEKSLNKFDPLSDTAKDENISSNEFSKNQITKKAYDNIDENESKNRFDSKYAKNNAFEKIIGNSTDNSQEIESYTQVISLLEDKLEKVINKNKRMENEMEKTIIRLDEVSEECESLTKEIRSYQEKE